MPLLGNEIKERAVAFRFDRYRQNTSLLPAEKETLDFRLRGNDGTG